MGDIRTVEIKRNVLAANDEKADAFRAARAEEGTFFVDVMASPGAGKTTLLLALIGELRKRGFESLGVIEADLESDVDALPSITFVKSDGTVVSTENGWGGWRFRIGADHRSLEFKGTRGMVLKVR